VFQKMRFFWDFSVRIGIFGAQVSFVADNRYSFHVTGFGRTVELVGARAMCVGPGSSLCVCVVVVGGGGARERGERNEGRRWEVGVCECAHPPPTCGCTRSFYAGGAKTFDISLVVDVLQALGTATRDAMLAGQSSSDVWIGLLAQARTSVSYQNYPEAVRCAS
jgi:hypothetical protein